MASRDKSGRPFAIKLCNPVYYRIAARPKDALDKVQIVTAMIYRNDSPPWRRLKAAAMLSQTELGRHDNP